MMRLANMAGGESALNLAESIRPLLAGKPPDIIAAALADLLALLIASHVMLDSETETIKLQEAMLQAFIDLVRKLIPPSREQIAELLAAQSKH